MQAYIVDSLTLKNDILKKSTRFSLGQFCTDKHAVMLTLFFISAQFLT